LNFLHLGFVWNLVLVIWCFLFAPSVRATPTQEDDFKSINDSVGSSVDGTKFFAGLIAAAAIVILLAVLGHRRQRQVVSRILNHQGRLLKEVCRSISLRPAEMRQLKILADEQGVCSPLTLLLCPSVL